MDKTGILFLGMQQLVKLENDKDVAITNLKSEIENLRSEINQLKAMVVTGQPAVSVQSDINNSASLQQNIPNPFSHSTTINYSLPISYSSAKIIITDKKGVVLKETNLSARGKGSLNVDAATLASGAYQYSLYVDGRLVSSRQMILSKQ